MKNDPTFNIHFVQLVEKYPQLFNFTLDTYNNKLEIERAWREIAETLHEPVQSCIEKWRTLRNNFNRTLRDKSSGSGQLSEKKSYYLSKYMQFLLPYLKSRQPLDKKSSKNPSVFEESTESFDIENSFPRFSNDNEKSSLNKNSESFNSDYISNSENIDTIHENSSYKRPKSKKKSLRIKKKLKYSSKKNKIQTQKEDSIQAAVLNYLEIETERCRKKQNNSDMIFFKSLLTDLGKLSDLDKIEFKMNVLGTLKTFLEKKN